MKKLILIDEDELRYMINEAVNHIFDKATKNVARIMAAKRYNNQIFSYSSTCSCGSSGSCGTITKPSTVGCGGGGGCGSAITSPRRYNDSFGGCGSSRGSGGC